NSEGEVVLLFTADIEEGWNVYSTEVDEGGPIPTSFSFEPSTDFSLIGNAEEEGEAVEGFDAIFEMHIKKFKKQAIFSQKIKLNHSKATIAGFLEFMVCDDTRCLPPQEVAFEIPVSLDVSKAKAGQQQESGQKEEAPIPLASVSGDDPASNKNLPTGAAETEEVRASPIAEENLSDEEPLTGVEIPENTNTELAHPELKASEEQDFTVEGTAGQESGQRSLWAIFFAGFVGGVAAFLMPCIFPMLPLTISYFTKGAESKGNAVGKSMFYGIS